MSHSRFDVVVVGASLSGASTAILLARAGASVAIVERRPDPAAFKTVCGHFIQSSAVPALERLGILDRMLDAGGVRSRFRVRTPWGWIESPSADVVPAGINLRRRRLDPLLRAIAQETPGVELIAGYRVESLVRDGDAYAGVRARDRARRELELRTRLVVGADGRDSRVAELAGVRTRRRRHGRFAYARYFEGAQPAGAPDATVWFGDGKWAAAFPTDSELTLYTVMDLHARRDPFRADPAAALEAFLVALPDPPPVRDSRPASAMIGRIDMTSVRRVPVAPGLALVGDAAIAADPLWGVGCGWAFQSADWLAASVAPALRGEEPLAAGLARYRRRHRSGLLMHALMCEHYATGRPFNALERLLLAGGVRDRSLDARLNAYVTRNIGPTRVVTGSMLPRAAVGAARGGARPNEPPEVALST